MSGGERITVGLSARATASLDVLVEATELSKTGVINRALNLLRLVEDQRAAGSELAFLSRDANGIVETRVVEFL